MNYSFIFRTISKLLIILAGFLVFPLLVLIIYREWHQLGAFMIPIILLLILGFIIQWIVKEKKRPIFAKEGFTVVSLSWIIISLFGMLPYVISGEIPNVFDAFFETVSGFTTTGATVLNNVEGMSRGMQLWRSLTHWMGGMGVLVFFLAFIPNIDRRSMVILKAESTGPQVGKLVSKMKNTAQILYGIYIGLTLVLFLLLWGLGLPLFDSVNLAMSTAGTGGFSITNASIAAYQLPSIEIVLATFMILFGINFTLFYLLIIGEIKKVWKNEEFRWYIIIVATAILLITINTFSIYGQLGDTLRYSFFHVASTISSTGYMVVDYTKWPAFSQWVIVLIMLVGASAGSTGGGIKVSRVLILSKFLRREMKTTIHPNQISAITMDGKALEKPVVNQVIGYIIAYFLLLLFGSLIITIDGHDVLTSFTTMVTVLSNIGPGLGKIGPTETFYFYSDWIKLFLSFMMLAGRLEIFPILILLMPRLWHRT